MKRSSIVLAAGHGTRMKSKKPKILHEILGKPMVLWVTEEIKNAGISEVNLIVGFQHERVISSLEGHQFNFVYQETQEGTGHAVRLGAEAITNLEDYDTILVACGDTPLMTQATLEKLISTHEANQNVMTVLTAFVENPFGYGRIISKGDNVVAIVEEKDASVSQKQINCINTGTYCFKGSFLKAYLNKLSNDNAQKEYYLTDLLKLAVNDGLIVGQEILEDEKEGLGVNNRVQLLTASEILQRRVLEKFLYEGVSFQNLTNVYVEPSVYLETDVYVEGNVTLKGNTSVGQGTILESGTRLIDAKIGEECVIKASVIWDAEVGNGCYIGPFAYLRPKTKLSDYVKIGDFVEVKNSFVGQGSKIPHLSYVGDSELGERINMGCGAITCNYDGINKHKTIIENDAFIGSNSNLVAPLVIKEGAVVGAGSTITKDVDSGSLALTRAPLKVVKSWKKK